MLFNVLSSIILAVAVSAANPRVVSPQGMTYQAGSAMDIAWDKDVSTGFVNIDVVDTSDGGVLQFPLTIAQGVPAEAGHYTWKIPSSLKSAANYQVRVWGSHQPMETTGAGMSQRFTILNTLPDAVTGFTVTSPSKERPCAAGTTCRITWDYPEMANHPAFVHINLYKVGSTEALEHIATVPSSQKIFDWVIPMNFASLGSDVYLSVSGEATPMVGPTMSNDMGGNSHAFMIQQAPPPSETKDANTDSTTDSKKKDMPKKDNKPKVNTPPKVEGQTKQQQSNAATTNMPSLAAMLVSAALLIPFAFTL